MASNSDSLAVKTQNERRTRDAWLDPGWEPLIRNMAELRDRAMGN
jgi:hypothetical protein